MNINPKEFDIHHLRYMIRPATEMDAKKLSEVRVQIDGETEHLDREKGEAYLNESDFKDLIKADTESIHNLFLVAEVDRRIIGFSRCEGNKLKRTAHQVEFGVCVLKEFWGHGVGTNLLKESINWADQSGLKKMTLKVLETNVQAIMLYKKYGFEVEGILKKDKYLSDGNYYNTVVMGRFSC